MAHGTHDFEDDARNERILIWVNGDLVPRYDAAIADACRPIYEELYARRVQV
jgi:hypothetical protein